MRKIFLFLISLFFLTSAPTQTVLLAGDYPDPTILKDGDDYYMTHSPLFYKPGFLIWHSRDLVNWEPYCRAEVDWKGSAWAPDLQKVGDTYYIYFPAEGGNWVTTAKDIRGPWTEPFNTDIGGIDPGLCVTPDGHRYLFTNGGQVTPLTDDGLHRSGQTERVYPGWQWTGWKEDISKVVKLKKGVLVMPGCGTTPQDARLMTTIATDVEYAIEAEVTIGKKDSQAGLLLYYCEKAFAGLTTDGKTFTIYKSATEKEEQPNILGRTLRIRLLNHATTLDILVSRDGTDWQTLAQGINISEFHHNRLGDFLALRPVLCSMGSGEAQFRNFQYVKHQ